MNWKHASNYVAKRYIDEVPKDVYLDDVILQMNAKLWGEEFNRHDPPKKVSSHDSVGRYISIMFGNVIVIEPSIVFLATHSSIGLDRTFDNLHCGLYILIILK